MRQTRVGRLALAGVFSALALVFLLFTTTPVATVGTAALAAVCGIPVVAVLGRGAGCMHYAVVTILAGLFIPSLEGKLMYFCFFGHYTVTKAWLEHFSLSRRVEYLLKTAVFFVSLGGYIGAWYSLVHPTLPDWFSLWMAMPAAVVLWGIFLLYDRCLTGLVGAYMTRLHPALRRLFHLG